MSWENSCTACPKRLDPAHENPEGQPLYALAPWIAGIWEFQLNNLDPEFIRLKDQYTEEGINPERIKSKISGMRTIPVEEEIASSSEIELTKRFPK